MPPRKSRIWLALAVVFASAPVAARAEPWWVAWEGTTLPEQGPWTRIVYAGGDQRTLENGTLALDGRASPDIADYYELQHAIEPAFGEYLELQWRFRCDEVEGFADPSVFVNVADGGMLLLRFKTNAVYSSFEWVWIPFTPGIFHEFRLVSIDLTNYFLYVDGHLAHWGQFVPSGGYSVVDWGDGTVGAASLSVWDYFRVGVRGGLSSLPHPGVRGAAGSSPEDPMEPEP